MQFVTLEDETGLVKAVLFPAAYAALGDPIRNPGPFLVGGTVETERRDLQLRVTDATAFHLRARPWEE